MKHIPVLEKEVLFYLAPSKNKNYIDATCGLGGHTKLILEKIRPNGRLLAIDQDKEALIHAKEKLKKYQNRVDFIKSNFTNLGLLVRSWKVGKIDGVLFDLGVSTYQLTDKDRGFSFKSNAILDMRMSPDSQRLTAKDIVNNYSQQKLQDILHRYGEEPNAKIIAKQIFRARNNKEIKTTADLVTIIKNSLPPKYRFEKKTHFATSTFRALRMIVNAELENLESGLKQAVQVLSSGGRLVVISFHSLEDRIVKQFLADNENLKILTPKPITVTQSEIIKNPSARSAKLRAAIKKENS